MSLESGIRNQLNSLKPTVTTIYSNNGDVHQESRNKEGNREVVKLESSSPGYVIDEVPDLLVARILPWLCLGSQDVVHDFELLKSNNITHILSIGIPSQQHAGIINTFIEAVDLDEFDIANIFERCFQVIEAVRCENGTVYVHCNAGVSRSPTVVAAYLIQYKRIMTDEAIRTIKLFRPKVNPNRGFMEQLREFERRILNIKNDNN